MDSNYGACALHIVVPTMFTFRIIALITQVSGTSEVVGRQQASKQADRQQAHRQAGRHARHRDKQMTAGGWAGTPRRRFGNVTMQHLETHPTTPRHKSHKSHTHTHARALAHSHVRMHKHRPLVPCSERTSGIGTHKAHKHSLMHTKHTNHTKHTKHKALKLQTTKRTNRKPQSTQSTQSTDDASGTHAPAEHHYRQ